MRTTEQKLEIFCENMMSRYCMGWGELSKIFKENTPWHRGYNKGYEDATSHIKNELLTCVLNKGFITTQDKKGAIKSKLVRLPELFEGDKND